MRDTFYANRGVLDDKTCDAIREANVVVVGLGGLGGHLANALVRMGVRKLTLIDPDTYVQSNLNRQLFSGKDTIGKRKVDVVEQALKAIMDDLEIVTYAERVEAVDDAVFHQADVVFDGVDDPRVKRALERRAGETNTLMVHGAIGGWYGQVAVLKPPSTLLASLYEDKEGGLERDLRCPTFTLGVISYWMVAAWAKHVLKHPSAKVNQLVMIDLLNDACEIMVEGTSADG